MARSGFYLPAVDVTASVVLLASSEGGRSEPFALTSELPWLRASLLVTNVDHGFDVRMEPDALTVDTLLPGATYGMQMIFLSPVDARREFRPGREFELWDGRAIGTGTVSKAPFRTLGPPPQ